MVQAGQESALDLIQLLTQEVRLTACSGCPGGIWRRKGGNYVYYHADLYIGVSLE